MSYSTIHPDFVLTPHGKGMILRAPSDMALPTSGIQVQNVLQLPMNVYFQRDEILLDCNEQVYLTHCCDSLGFYSHQDLRGIRFDRVAKSEYLRQIVRHDQVTLKNGGLSIFEEEILTHHDISVPVLTFKFPCVIDCHKPPIIFGISLLIDNACSPAAASLAPGLSMLLSLGLISAHNTAEQLLPGRKIDGVYLTSRQLRCVELGLRGMTAKKIAATLGISFRTVERHFENLKHKLKVQSKSELLEKIVSYQQKSL